jgi:hypothetical protein
MTSGGVRKTKFAPTMPAGRRAKQSGAVGPGRCCSPHQLTHFEPSSLELKGTL